MAVPLVGLTGGLGAGKTTALAELAELGAVVLSADDVVRELYADAAVRDAVRERFGDEVFDGARVERVTLAARVFAHDEDRRWLEQLLWPLVAQRAQEFHDEASSRVPPPRAAVFEAPLLFEADSQARYAATIAVIAEDSVRAERLGARPRGRTQLAQRDAHQLPQEEKARRATYVIVNNGSVAELREQLAAVLERLGR